MNYSALYSAVSVPEPDAISLPALAGGIEDWLLEDESQQLSPATLANRRFFL